MKNLFDILLLPIGLAVLIKGADWLVEGAITLAKRLGLSPLIIGLTIVAMGTSAPEVAASIAAALAGSGDIAVGNVYGSNIANLALVGGLCAMIRPIGIRSASLWRDMPIMIASMLLLWPILQSGMLTRGSGLLLLLVFTGILIFMIRSERKRHRSSYRHPEEEVFFHKAPRKVGISVLYIGFGLLALAAGAKLTVYSASVVGRMIGLSEAVIGLTIIAVGTSLPELMTCLVASFKGHDDLSIGNLVGSNIFNTLLVLGTAGLVQPFPVSQRLQATDYWIMVAVSVLFSGFAVFNRRINRPVGLFLSLVYLSYLIYLFVQK